MCCGVLKDELIVRMAPETAAEAIAAPDAQLFDFTGKPMKGMVAVSNACEADDAVLESWVKYGTDFVATLPPR